ncbi:unnamed protein product [Linum trigynum]|uniref:Uncharacterized protein n=1 Tax=Linum trigynum TaxID=586398 RepID=A0AAV2G0N0_9ROSI
MDGNGFFIGRAKEDEEKRNSQPASSISIEGEKALMMRTTTESLGPWPPPPQSVEEERRSETQKFGE